MNFTLVRKNIRDARWLLLACVLTMFAFCWLRVWIVSLIDTARFQQILDLLPGDWQRFTPVDFSWLITYAGRISLTYDEPLVFVGMAVWVIARGSDCVSGELGRGTMEMIMAQPVSRLHHLFTHASVTVGGVVLLSLATWVGIYAGIHTFEVKEEVMPTLTIPIPVWEPEVPIPWADKEVRFVPMSEKVAADVFVPGAVNFCAMGFFLAGLAAFVSACDRYRWRTIGIVVGFVVVETIVKILAMASDRIGWLKYFSIFTAYEPEQAVAVATDSPQETWSILFFDAQHTFQGLGPLGYNLVFILAGCFCYIAALAVFSRRDLPAPL